MKPFAIYFPQFYSIATNDRAWGKGFTDWALVAHANLHDRWSRRAPRRGFYDGSDPAVHAAQMQEMQSAGLGGMAVYHYWFYTHQELPVFEQALLASPPRSKLPWFLVWASEGWSRRWLGDPRTIATLTPSPSNVDIREHCHYLMRCFNHPSYFRWRGKPLFIWYHLGHFDDPEKVVNNYRECLAQMGTEIATGHFIKNPFDARHSALVDVSYLFEPRLYFGTRRKGRGGVAKAAFERMRGVVGEGAAQRLLTLSDRFQQRGRTFSAADHLRYLAGDERARLVRSLPGVVQEVISPGWNNAPRYDLRYTALQDLPVTSFKELVRRASSTDAPPALINAWNEWSEGAAIEPCAYLGTRYLDEIGTNEQQPISTTAK
jgi:Glycosyltransferase WbsX